MRLVSTLLVVLVSLLMTGCPDKANEIGGAPKRQIDHVEDSVDRATENVEGRLKRAEDAAEE